MKQQKFDSEEALEIIAAMEAAQQEAQKENMGARLKELAYELEQLKRDHPEEYWEAAVTMDPMPTLIPRRGQEQKDWRVALEKRGIWIKGKGTGKHKGGRYFDPKLPLNKDIIEAWEGVKQLQYQMKDSDLPWAVELRNLPPLSEATVDQWEPWIILVLYAQTDQKPEENARAAGNIHERKKSQTADPKKNPTRAAVRNDLVRDLRTPQKGALLMLARDLDRVKGVEY
jgi:hypothetical protein